MVGSLPRRHAHNVAFDIVDRRLSAGDRRLRHVEEVLPIDCPGRGLEETGIA